MKFLAMFQNPQFLAAARHALTAAAAIAVTLGVISASDSEQIVSVLISIGQAIGQLGAAVAALVAIVGPLYATISASDKNQIKRVETIAADPTSPKSEEAQVALVKATASLAAEELPQTDAAKQAIVSAAAAIPEVDKVVAPSIAASVPSEKVVTR